MHLSTDIGDLHTPKLWRDFISITGWDVWKKRMDSLRQQSHHNLLHAWLLEKRHSLEFQIEAIHRYFLLKNKLPRILQNPQLYRAAAFACSAARIYQRLSSDAKNRFCGMIISGLKDEYGLESFAFELEIANHLMRKGYDVTFSDLEQQGDYDYLIKHLSGQVEIEVECKLITGDKGRKVHQTCLAQLLGQLEPIVRPLLLAPGGKIVHIEVPSRLEANRDTMRQIASTVEQKIAASSAIIQSRVCTVEITNFDVRDSPFSNPQSINSATLPEFIGSHFDVRLPTLTAFSSHTGDACVVVEVHSRESDSLVKRIYRVAKESAQKQFSHTRPALIALKLGELTSRQIRELHQLQQNQEPHALQAIATRFFRNSSRDHVHSMCFLSQSEIFVEQTSSGLYTPGGVQGQGSVYVFQNLRHPAYNDPRYYLFN